MLLWCLSGAWFQISTCLVHTVSEFSPASWLPFTLHFQHLHKMHPSACLHNLLFSVVRSLIPWPHLVFLLVFYLVLLLVFKHNMGKIKLMLLCWIPPPSNFSTHLSGVIILQVTQRENQKVILDFSQPGVSKLWPVGHIWSACLLLHLKVYWSTVMPI